MLEDSGYTMSEKKYSIFDVIKDGVKGDLKISGSDLASERIAICNVCPELIPTVRVCGQCGCLTTAKVKIQLASCPIGKW